MSFDEIQQIFFLECDEGLAAMESNFLLCRDGQHDDETINTIFRAIHSIKGGAGAFGHEALREFSHHYETVLDKLRNNELALTPTLLDTCLAAFDMLSDHVAASKGERGTPNDAAVLARLAAAGGEAAESEPEAPAAAEPEATPTPTAADFDPFADEEPIELGDLMAILGDEEAPATPWTVRYKPDARAFDHGGEPLLLLRELQRLGGTAIAADLSTLPALDAINPEESYLGWTFSVPGSVGESEIRDIFEFSSGACELEISGSGSPEPGASAPAAIETTAAVVEAPPPPAPIVAAPAAAAPAPAKVEPVAPAALAPVAPKPEAKAPPPAAPIATTAAPAVAAGAAAAVQTIRVDLDKLDRLVNLVGELVITQAMLAQRLSLDNLAGISELTDLDHLTRELQDSAMSIRAQPMKTVFSRVPRIIRELESDTGKRVRLEVEGEMTEVDKTVVERIGEPLTHMIRNAVDHGLETPDERVAAGKPAEGVVRLAAEHRSGRIVISIADDGRGIDRERVRQKAIEKGLISADAQLSEEETDNLIFAPGFSTAATLSSISGRGVGMDVVRKNVQALGGRIGIVSKLGSGSTFSLSLPLTLAVLDGMIVRVGDQTFVIPLSHIVESLRPQGDEVKRLGVNGAVLDVRGSYVPIHRVGEQLAIPGAVADPTKAVLIVVESDHGQAVLMVDTILDQRQVVVKSLEANYAAVHGLAGATILGDGRVALILDVDALVSRWRHDSRVPELGVAA